jgi:hypothetical protein
MVCNMAVTRKERSQRHKYLIREVPGDNSGLYAADDFGSNDDLLYIYPVIHGYNERIMRNKDTSQPTDLAAATPVRTMRAHTNLDMGAGCTLIDSKFVEALGICAHNNVNALDMAGFNGSRTYGDHHVSLRIEIPGSQVINGVRVEKVHEMQIQAIVVQNMMVPLLLGATHLLRNNLQLPRARNSEGKWVATIGPHDVQVECDEIRDVRAADADRENRTGVKTDEHIASVRATVIPPHMPAMVRINTKLGEGLWAAHTFDTSIGGKGRGV